MKVFGVIYLITNKINGLQYVGQTNNLKKRIKAHKHGDQYIDRAIQKYGWENFTVKVLEECKTREQLNEREIFWIAALNTKIPNGYNVTDGGDGWTGCSPTAEHRRKTGAGNRHETPFKNLLNAIVEREFTYTSLAKRMGVSIQTISDKMLDKCNFTVKDVDKLVEIFGLPAEYLMARDDGLATMISGVKDFAESFVEKRSQSPFKNLLKELKANNMSCTTLAKFLGLIQQTISDKMLGKQNFTASQAAKMEEFFGKPAEYLLARDDGVPITFSKFYRTPYRNLLNEIERQKFTYKALAKILGFAQQNFSAKMRGELNFTAKDKAKLVEIFNKPIEYLMFKEEL